MKRGAHITVELVLPSDERLRRYNNPPSQEKVLDWADKRARKSGDDAFLLRVEGEDAFPFCTGFASDKYDCTTVVSDGFKVNCRIKPGYRGTVTELPPRAASLYGF